jgi:hypothetical protein
VKKLKPPVWSANHGGSGDNCGNMFSLTAAEETLAVIEGIGADLRCGIFLLLFFRSAAVSFSASYTMDEI